MRKREAAKVKVGDTLTAPFYGKTGKVEKIYPEPCEECSKGNFPLFKMDFDETPLTYKHLQKVAA